MAAQIAGHSAPRGSCSESADTAFADREHRKKQIEHDLESPAFDEATALHSEQAGGGLPHRGIVGDRAARHRGDGL